MEKIKRTLIRFLRGTKLFRCRRLKVVQKYKEYKQIKRRLENMDRKSLLRLNEKLFLTNSGKELPFRAKLAMLKHSRDSLLNRTIMFMTFKDQNTKRMKKMTSLDFDKKINFIKLIKNIN